jgi:hypothetical protein
MNAPKITVRPGQRVRWDEERSIFFREYRTGPDGIVDGDVGTVLADQDGGWWTVEFPDSPFGIAELHEAELVPA